MTDNQLIAAIISILQPPIQAQFGASMQINAKNQPTQQGVPSVGTVYIEKLFDKRYGFEGVDFDLSALQPGMPVWTPITTTYKQLMETTIQFSALVIQDPTNISLPTASDVVNFIAMLMGTDAILAALSAAGANVERIIQVRNPYFHDDRERFEAHPSFDVVFQHERDLVVGTDPIQSVNIGIYPI
jgi:hypothetical protein